MRKRRPRLRRTAGFSLIEALVAAALLLGVAVGILPLITRSMENNLRGHDATAEANAATDVAEDVSGARFHAAAVTFATGATSDERAWEYQPLGGSDWLTSLPAGEHALISRRTVLQQYQIQLDGNIVLVPGTSVPGLVHIKETRIQVGNARGGRPFGTVAYAVILRKAI